MKYRSYVISLLLVVAVALIPVSYVAATDGGHHGGNLGTHLVDPIMTDAGLVSGTVMDHQTLAVDGIPTQLVTVGTIGEKVHIYRGIPYAAPPVGDLRWKPPQPVTPWKGIREATALTKWPPQAFPTADRYGPIQESGMSEDCLYLNVITPANKEKDRLPVLVWFHGGGLTAQSGSRPSYNTPPLAQHGVVVVTVTGRLGVIGFMAHPGLTAESGGVSSGNYGMLDLIAALKWVKNNIAAFGGDPGRVTIFGQSGGGMKVNWLMGSPLSKGLFHAAIDMAGIQGGTPLVQSEQRGVNLANKLGITGSNAAVIAAMRAKTWQEIVTASLASGSGFTTDTTIDGWSQIDTMLNVFKAGMQHDVPLMIGIAEKDLKSIYENTVKIVPSTKPLTSNMYAYMFAHVPTGWKEDGAIAWHSLENGYVFGQPWLMVPGNYDNYGVPNCAKDPDPGWDWKDDWMTEFMVKTWIQFAATGDPNLPKHAMGTKKPLPIWPSYVYGGPKSSSDKYYYIVVPPEVRTGFSTLVYPSAPCP
jgi:para-nitrobenzyl esterase